MICGGLIRYILRNYTTKIVAWIRNKLTKSRRLPTDRITQSPPSTSVNSNNYQQYRNNRQTDQQQYICIADTLIIILDASMLWMTGKFKNTI